MTFKIENLSIILDAEDGWEATLLLCASIALIQIAINIGNGVGRFEVTCGAVKHMENLCGYCFPVAKIAPILTP